MSAISQNISTLLNNIPFNQLFQNSLQYSQPIINQMAQQFTNQQVIETVKSSLKQNDIDFSTIVSEIINATITKLSEPQTKQEINQILNYYATHATDSIPTWLLIFFGSVLVSILMIPSLLMAILLQQVFPVRKMKWYQRIFINRFGKAKVSQQQTINDEEEERRRLVYNENIQQ
ncbi:predicted protein [Naegleria gruberi]|uniref:Predicted protein n=1 Tax=Naegleria gruberi TaxID=5762 RepID=D2W577_NAEGR|nr:uncharacterized protein NAEGRDRAFT_76566 [Naegleria gruberi]EFC35776.1 predicted protein [Naegleria gruberi]|eukprot:XP_002668520.1 predicted protein [Naegleria gruberi strain NEG-M]